MKKRLSRSDSEQIKTAYASGIPLREIARNMNIPEGTVLARAKREGWTREIQSAKALSKREDAPGVSPVKAVAMTMQQRGERHVERVSRIVEKTLPHVEAMEPGAILNRIHDVDKLDRIGRRTYKLDDIQQTGGLTIQLLNMVSGGEQ
jgi:hypothetical protein